MKTILVTAYAVNPYKGSEDGMGWNAILQIARFNSVIAITRRNNREDIEKYISENPACITGKHNIEFKYFDLPKWTRWWKKGPLLSVLYFYMWQMGLVVFVSAKKLKFDIAHNLNFHNDWTPTFLWALRKPLVWGPIGHHSLIPKQFLQQYGFKALLKDRILWGMKNLFWTLDPFLWITRLKAKRIICMNSSVPKKLSLSKHQYRIIPSVAVEKPEPINFEQKEKFTVMIAARMVPLKAFDVVIKAFALFKSYIPKEEHHRVELKLIGSGPEEKQLKDLVIKHELGDETQFIPWLERKSLLKLYGQTSVFFFPSHEGAGMVVAEALSYGVPVLCFDNYGPGELTPPKSSLKIPYSTYHDSIELFTKKLLALYNDKDLQQHEGHLGKEHFNAWLNWDIRGIQYKHIYQEILSYEKNISHSFA